MAAMGYLPVEFAADDKTGDAEILPPVNHDCQPINFYRWVAPSGMFPNWFGGRMGYGLDAEEPAEASAALSRSSSVSAFWIRSTSLDSKKGSPHCVHTHAGTVSQDT